MKFERVTRCCFASRTKCNGETSGRRRLQGGRTASEDDSDLRSELPARLGCNPATVRAMCNRLRAALSRARPDFVRQSRTHNCCPRTMRVTRLTKCPPTYRHFTSLPTCRLATLGPDRSWKETAQKKWPVFCNLLIKHQCVPHCIGRCEEILAGCN